MGDKYKKLSFDTEGVSRAVSHVDSLNLCLKLKGLWKKT